MQGCKLAGCNKIIQSNHRNYVIGLNIAIYFNTINSTSNIKLLRILNPSKRIHLKVHIETVKNTKTMLLKGRIKEASISVIKENRPNE